MWVILPVKSFDKAKIRLAEVLNPSQRAQLSYLMLDDILKTLHTSDDVTGITIVSSDKSVRSLANRYQAEFLLNDTDGGYSEDATLAITKVSQDISDTIAIIPSDVPQLSHDDLSQLKLAHDRGLTLCPALIDGGTNGLLFKPPLNIPLMFGIDSLSKYKSAAQQLAIPLKIEVIAGLQRDIDRPEDLFWLRDQHCGGQAWLYISELLKTKN